MSNNQELISVIIPVYNVESYLRRCVKSVQAQVYNNLEIILVDDGSKDSSGQICDELAAEDSRIKVIHQENAGLACARNSGLRIYTGEYVCFIDSDDYILPNYIDYMHSLCIGTGCKMAFCESFSTSEDTYDIAIDRSLSPVVYDSRDLLDQFYGDMHCVITVAWNKLIHRSVVGDTIFEPGVIHEDEATTFKYIYNARKVVYTANPLYCYYTRPESITGVGYSAKNLDILIGYERRMSFYKEKGELALYNKEYIYYMSAILINYYKVKHEIKDNKKLLSDLLSKYKELYAGSREIPMSISRKALYYVCNVFPLLYGVMRRG